MFSTVIDSGQHQTCLPHVASDPQQIRCRCMQAQEVALTLPSKRSIDIERCVSQLVVWLQLFVTVTNELCVLCDDSDPSVKRARPVSIQTCLQRFWQSYCQSKSWKALVKPRITKTHVVQMKPFPQSPPSTPWTLSAHAFPSKISLLFCPPSLLNPIRDELTALQVLYIIHHQTSGQTESHFTSSAGDHRTLPRWQCHPPCSPPATQHIPHQWPGGRAQRQSAAAPGPETCAPRSTSLSGHATSSARPSRLLRTWAHRDMQNISSDSLARTG